MSINQKSIPVYIRDDNVAMRQWQKFVKSLDGRVPDFEAIEGITFFANDAKAITDGTIGKSPLSELKMSTFLSPPKISDRQDQHLDIERFLPPERISRLFDEYQFLGLHSASEEALEMHEKQVMQLPDGSHEHVFNLQFSPFKSRSLAVKKSLLGSSDIDATIVTFDNDWFRVSTSIDPFLSDVKHTKKNCAITCRGAELSDMDHIVQMWQMIDHVKIGCVTSVLGEEDIGRASWASLNGSSSKYFVQGNNVRVTVLSEDASQDLPKDVQLLYRACVGKLHSASGGKLHVSIRKLQYKLNKNPVGKVLHILVQNWTDMVAMLKPKETQFLYRLALLINGISDISNTGALAGINTHRQVFHCSAGCGRSNVVMAATFLCRPKVGPLNSNIFDLVAMLKASRHHAINSFEHYASLDLLLLRLKNRPRLIAATILADEKPKDVKHQLSKWWFNIVALRDAPQIMNNVLWYTHLLQDF